MLVESTFSSVDNEVEVVVVGSLGLQANRKPIASKKVSRFMKVVSLNDAKFTESK